MIVLLFCAGLIAGALNSVAGGGSFITLPALIYGGVTPVSANATSTFALWPGSISSAIAYRRELAFGKRHVVLGAASLAGGLLGALLLVRTSDVSFLRLLPWLMLAAAASFTFGSRAVPRQSRPVTARPAGFAALAGLQFLIAVYGGYFGGGIGIMMLASFELAGMRDIHEMNGLKSVLGATINGLALLAFVIEGIVRWPPGVVMMAGSIAGGWLGASVARRIDRRWVRLFVLAVGWTMTVYFFVRSESR